MDKGYSDEPDVFMQPVIWDNGNIYTQLWFWDYKYIHSVEYPDQVLVPNGKAPFLS